MSINKLWDKQVIFVKEEQFAKAFSSMFSMQLGKSIVFKEIQSANVSLKIAL